MSSKKFLLLLAVIVIFVITTPVWAERLNAPISAAAAAGPVSFTLEIKSAFGRSQPSLSAERVQSLFQGQAYTVLARTADNLWLKLDYAGASTEVWVPAELGAVKGDLAKVPEAGAATPVAAAQLPALAPVSARAREVYQYGLTLGNHPRIFTRVGDCNSTTPYFLAAFDTPGNYRLGPTYAYLQETLNQFAGSFARESLTARIGFTPLAAQDPVWSNPRQCQGGETPLACEYRLHHPSLVFVSLGTNGNWLSDAEYESGLRYIIEFSVQRGVVPILGTKADNLETGDRFNRIVKELAAEYEMPVWDFRAAVENLPDHGLLSDGAHLQWGPAFYDLPDRTPTGMQVRNLTALQTLDAVWRAVR